MPSTSPTDRDAARAARSGDDAPARPGRRNFLLLTAGATSAAAAATGAAQTIESPVEQVDARYSRTPHVERFYFLNRL